MKPGPAPLPTNVHLLNNNPSKKSGAELEGRVAVPVSVPPCPRQLSAPARAEWRRIVPHLVKAGLITHLDRGVLVGYCQAWGEWVLLEQKVKELIESKGGVDGLIDVTPSGYKQISALVQVRDRALDRLLRFGKEFGLSPSSRVSVTSGQQMGLPGIPNDPMEHLLAAGSVVRNAG